MPADKLKEEELLSTINGDLIITGDARADSPGHFAKYGAYTVVEQLINKLLIYSWFRHQITKHNNIFKVACFLQMQQFVFIVSL